MKNAGRQPWSASGLNQQVTGRRVLTERQWVRLYHAWYRHITLSMLALAFLAVIRGSAKKGARGLWAIPGPGQGKHPGQA